MPGEDIQSWSATASVNGTADSLINWQEGQARASVNDSARSMMAAHAKNRNLLNGSIVTAGTANAQTFTSGVSYTTVPTGLRALLKVGVTNTGASTLNMDGIGDVAIKYPDGSDLRGGEFTINSYADLIYGGTNWVLLASIPPDPVTASPPGTVQVVPPITVANTPLVDFTAHIDGSFDHYIFDFYDVVPASTSDALALRFSIDGGMTFVAAASYYNAYALALYPGVGAAFGGSIITHVFCSSTISATPPSVCSGTVDLYHPAGTGKLKHVIVKCAHWNNTDGSFRLFHNGGVLNTTSAVNGIRFLMQSGGNIGAGTFQLYGARK